ncbi:MAG: nicotinate-nucleotide adenylyltransferase [Alphaproteobacteria bacterium]|nr:nicotinate-nucleotide adenylyltransferase [Alphaproteobacteria bacterium]MBV9692306.1 nicotinate-nucleotide adenylyltransferase [Alphaproteobacteria bacterium]
MRIGLLGGSFNPAHEGHRYVSEVALRRLGLDQVWWLVTPRNPLKSPHHLAPIEDRLESARPLASHPRIVVLDIERALGTHYSIDTLKRLRRRFAQVQFVWLMGSDNLRIFDRWRRWQEIAALVPIAVVLRPGTVLATLSSKAMARFRRNRRCGGQALSSAPCIVILDGHRNAQSSTALRAQGRLAEALLASIPPC